MKDYVKDNTARHSAAQASSRASSISIAPSPQPPQSASRRQPLLITSSSDVFSRYDSTEQRFEDEAKPVKSSQGERERKIKMEKNDVLGEFLSKSWTSVWLSEMSIRGSSRLGSGGRET